MTANDSHLPATIARGIAAGLAGTVVMTAFQKLVEMPLTGRPDSYAPANFAQKVLRIEPKDQAGRERLNNLVHFGLGALWGGAYGVAAHRGLRGQKAVGATFSVLYPGDVLLNTALGLYKPTTWTKQDTLIDVGNKLVQAEATGAIFDRFLAPARRARV